LSSLPSLAVDQVTQVRATIGAESARSLGPGAIILTFLKAYPEPMTARVVPIMMGTGWGIVKTALYVGEG